MSDGQGGPHEAELVFEHELEAPPEKVWRAISIPAFRERWLPPEALRDAEPFACVEGREIGYLMREEEAPFAESVVLFQIRPNATGGTRLRIVHRLPADGAGEPRMRPANGNRPLLMRAA